MIRYFICENCHRGYEADDAVNTNCPYCKSDNVRPAKKPSDAGRKIGIAAVFAASCAVGLLLPIGNKEKPVEEVLPIQEKVVEIPAPVVQAVQEVNTDAVPVVKSVSAPAFAKDVYSFKAVAEVKSGDKLRYMLMDEFGADVLYLSDDGKFADVAPVKSGVYKLVVENAKTKDRSEEKMISGFRPVVKVEQITQADLQAKFNTGTMPPKDYMSRIISKPKMSITGMQEGEPPVGNVGEVFNRIASGTWSSVTVSDVQYASDNRIIAFTLNVNY